MEEPRKRIAAEMSGLGIHYDLGEGHPLVGRRMPDLDLATANGQRPAAGLQPAAQCPANFGQSR
jgi:3-(3-hydroxy-phenyl)propionate hydroxylase